MRAATNEAAVTALGRCGRSRIVFTTSPPTVAVGVTWLIATPACRTPKERPEADARVERQGVPPGDRVAGVDDELERDDAEDCPAEAPQVVEEARGAHVEDERREEGEAGGEECDLGETGGARPGGHAVGGSGLVSAPAGARMPPVISTRRPSTRTRPSAISWMANG